MKTGLVLAGGLLLAACGGAGGARPETAAYKPIPFPSGGGSGLAAVMGRDASQLGSLFGQPTADVREGPGRKLQFAGPICVLDAYLYARGSGQPVVTYVDARQTDGSSIDKSSCVAALRRRK